MRSPERSHLAVDGAGRLLAGPATLVVGAHCAGPNRPYVLTHAPLPRTVRVSALIRWLLLAGLLSPLLALLSCAPLRPRPEAELPAPTKNITPTTAPTGGKYAWSYE